MPTSRTRRLIATAATACLAATLTFIPPAMATPSAGPGHHAIDAAATDRALVLSPELDISAGQVARLGAVTQAAARTEQQLQADLGESFGGAWLTSNADGPQQLIVAITDRAHADQVRQAGAEPRLVRYSKQHLTEVKEQLDQAGAAPESVAGWHIAVQANTVVVRSVPGGIAAAREFIDASGVASEQVQIWPDAQLPQLLRYPLREGDHYFTSTSRCTIGFLVRFNTGQNGFVTAGHCGQVGDRTWGFNSQPQGIFWASVFPGNDAAVVAVNNDWIPRPRFAGSQEAPIGATVCMSSPISGFNCGTVQAKNQTVNYPEGVVHGLTRTTLCSHPGDSGAPVFSGGDQAQGVVSGGSGSCQIGVTFFQPLNPMLSSWDLSLITS